MKLRIFRGKYIKAALLLTASVVLVFTLSKTLGAQGSDSEAQATGAVNLQGETRKGTAASLVSESRLSCIHYVDNDFKRSVKAAVPYDLGSRLLIGGIVTHHLLADNLISSFFASISASKPELVFVIGPNHKRVGSSKINTGYWDWQSPYGLLESDDAAVKSLVEACGAGQDFNLLEAEHSVSTLVPYIKYYMPEARIVPILLHGNLGLRDSKLLAENIVKAAGDKRWIVIASIDFSHYLPPDTAEKMDEITLKAIEAEDLEAIGRMGNENMDSPPSALTMLEIVRSKGEYELEVAAHSNSAEIAGTYSESTTSYFTMFFYLNGETHIRNLNSTSGFE